MNPTQALATRTLIGMAVVLLAGAAHAAEVDSFTRRHALGDSAPFLNQVVNVWMEEAVIEANRPPLITRLTAGERAGCDETRLMAALKDRFADYLVGQLESFANESTALDSIRTTFADSIYRDLNFSESPTVLLTERLAVLIRLGDVYLGSDKLGHFFTEGRTYYTRYIAENERSALRYGELTESSFYGELTTGIFSYADLAANLNGLRFWNSILAKKPDPIDGTQPVRPYIGCTEGKWRRLRPFDWRDYVDPAWDEALNCNAYRDDAVLKKVTRRIAQASHGKGCPLQRVDERQLQRKYGKRLGLVFNRRGARVLKSFNQELKQYWEEIMP